ncbi:MAG: ABC transporter permease [Candidatus Heimdallarchaeota archaeon]|nr:ABC transporter permease [Candidatus Heimdallarchaeota archaeon]
MNQNHDWLDDDIVSVSGEDFIYGSYVIDTNLLSKAIAEVNTKLDAIMPNVQKTSSGRLKLDLYHKISDQVYNGYNLLTFNVRIINLIEDNLIDGRMPQNYTELIYYKSTSESKFNVGENLELSGMFPNLVGDYNPINYSIVGIVSNLDAKLYNNGLSTDLMNNSSNNRVFELEAQFFTTNDLFYDLINTVENFRSILNAAIDIAYQFTIDHIRNKNSYITAIQDFWLQYHEFSYMPGYSLSFCHDLVEALGAFEHAWQTKTISLIGASIPIVFLFGVISIEAFSIGKYEQESKFRLLKTQGLDQKNLTKLLFLEYVITMASSFLIGFAIGLIIGFCIFMGLNILPEVSYFASLRQAIIISSLVLLFVIFTLTKFILDCIQLRKVSTTTTELYKSRRRKIIRKIFTFPEVSLLLLGAMLSTVGIIFLYIFTPYFDNSIGPDITHYIFMFYFISAFGFLLLLISIFLIFDRAIVFIWKIIGKSSWKQTKNHFTLALKHLSLFGKNYQRTMMAIFVFGIGVIPGLIMSKSISIHTPLEADLATGCSDILIEDWIIGDQLKDNITNINGIIAATEITILELAYYVSTGNQYKEYNTRFYTLLNISEYLNVVNFTLLKDSGYTETDIIELNTNFTYLMNRKYAQRNDYDNGVIFNTKGITNEIYQPIDLIYINDFDYFPLLSRTDSNINAYGDFTFNKPTKIDCVVSKMTAELILSNTSISTKDSNYLLIKTEATANKTSIQEELSNQFGYKSITPEQIYEINSENINRFTKVFLIISSIIISLAVILFGMVNARNIYKQRLRIIESEIQIGAKRRFVWGNLTIELILIALIPMVISMGIAVPIIKIFSSYLLNITEDYVKFIPWQPWWLPLLVAMGGFSLLIIGWFAGLIPLVNSYKPIKQES